MTPNEQRAAIAIACGIVTHDQWGPLYRTPQGLVRDCPDFHNDLNAIAEARKILTPDQQVQFSIEVGKIVTRSLRVNQAQWMDFCLIDAASSRQCEAFLRTIGKWEEDK